MQESTRHLSHAKHFLMTPDYFHFLLCGRMACERTICVTTGLYNVHMGAWDSGLISACGYPAHIFPKIVPSGTFLGGLQSSVRDAVGFDCKVIAPAAHDTACAAMTVPDGSLFISSGTWSLVGLCADAPICTADAMAQNFTNSGAYGGKFLFLRSNMGMYMIERIRQELKDAGREHSPNELLQLAKKCAPCDIDVNDARFFAPESMSDALKDACGRPDMSVGEMAATIYHGLARSYADTFAALEQILGKAYDKVTIVGGGSKAAYLNSLTEFYSKKAVCVGAAEATAIGNIMAQMITLGSFADLGAARLAVMSTQEGWSS